MKKFIINNCSKFIIAMSICFVCLAGFFVITKSYAYSINDEGNLVGDNLLFIENGTFTSGDLTIEKNNGSIILNGSTSSSYVYYTLGSITFNSNETYYISGNGSNLQVYLDKSPYYTNNAFTGVSGTYNINIEVAPNKSFDNSIYFPMVNIGNQKLDEWEPYGVWYSESNYDTLEDLYNNQTQSYNDLIFMSNFGFWKYIDYAEFTLPNDYIYVPGSSEATEWSLNDLYVNNILKVGGYFDTTPLTQEPYQSNYQRVNSYLNFKANTPSESIVITPKNAIGCQIQMFDTDGNSFTYVVSDDSTRIDAFFIRGYNKDFGNYISEIYFTPNNADANGIYFANNEFTDAYNKGWNASVEKSRQIYLPQINDYKSKIEELESKVYILQIKASTLASLNEQLQEQINNNFGWSNLFFAFADTPFKVVSNVLGFELFGINLFTTFIGMVTVFGIVYLIKKFI